MFDLALKPLAQAADTQTMNPLLSPREAKRLAPVPSLYTSNAMGNMLVVEALSESEALSKAKSRAAGSSMLPSDVQSVRLATPDEIAWYRGMGGTL